MEQCTSRSGAMVGECDENGRRGASTTAIPRFWVAGGVGGVETRGREEEKLGRMIFDRAFRCHEKGRLCNRSGVTTPLTSGQRREELGVIECSMLRGRAATFRAGDQISSSRPEKRKSVCWRGDDGETTGTSGNVEQARDEKDRGERISRWSMAGTDGMTRWGLGALKESGLKD